MFERFARPARIAIDDARYEAGRRGDRRIGTEHLLIALLRDDELAGIVGVDAETAHDTADQLDRSALAAIGLEADPAPTAHAALGTRVPLTAGVKAVLHQTILTATAEKARTITTRHMMLALLDRREPDPAAALLAALPIDPQATRERLSAAA
ncbi:MAG TPA: Clp protease N-terminal domain-containing protein [Microbacteriaceae bacterium]